VIAYCCECGRIVPMATEGQAGHCVYHPDAKRYSEKFAAERFAAMRAAVEEAEQPRAKRPVPTAAENPSAWRALGASVLGLSGKAVAS